jgi:hypothetical protein
MAKLQNARRLNILRIYEKAKICSKYKNPTLNLIIKSVGFVKIHETDSKYQTYV